MKSDRVFTDKELEDMGRRQIDIVTEAIDSGSLAQAKDVAQRMYRECLATHDFLIEWVTALLTFVGQRYGDEVLYQALEEGCRAWLEPLTEVFANADVRRRVIIMAKILRGHLMPVKIEEDDDKFTFILDPCGSGGKLIATGKYQPPRDFLKISNAQPMTFGRKGFPVYCAHHYFEELVPCQLVGYPLFTCEPAENLGDGPCRVYLYKNPRAAPKRRQDQPTC